MCNLLIYAVWKEIQLFAMYFIIFWLTESRCYQSGKAASRENVRVSLMYSLIMALCAACVTALWLSPPQFSSEKTIRSLQPVRSLAGGWGTGIVRQSCCSRWGRRFFVLKCPWACWVDCWATWAVTQGLRGLRTGDTCYWLADSLILQTFSANCFLSVWATHKYWGGTACNVKYVGF